MPNPSAPASCQQPHANPCSIKASRWGCSCNPHTDMVQSPDYINCSPQWDDVGCLWLANCLVHRNRQGQHAKPQFFIKEWRSDKEWDRSQLLRPKHRGGQLPTVHLWSCCLADAPTYLTDFLRMNCLWLAGSNFCSCLRQTYRYTITCLSIWNFWRGGRYIFTAFNIFTTLPASPPLKNHTNFQIYNYRQALGFAHPPTIGYLTNQLTTFLLSIFPPPWQPMLLMIQVQVQHSFYQCFPPPWQPMFSFRV